MTVLSEITGACSAAWKPREILSIAEWGEQNVFMDRTAAMQGRWKLSTTPWAVYALRAFQDPAIRDMTSMACSQGAKTARALVCLAWLIKNAPGPVLWLTGDDDLAKKASQERIMPTLERCPPVKDLLSPSRCDNGIWTIRTSLCTVDISGAQSSTALEQNPYRWMLLDECRQFPEGSLQKVEKRQRTYPNGKRFKFSTPAESGDEFHESFRAGTQCEWVFPCMGCGEWLPLVWNVKFSMLPEEWRTKGMIRWDENELTRPSGRWNSDELVKTIRYECCKCNHHHRDSARVRRHILDAGRYESMNLNAPKEKWSEHWNAMLPGWIRWRDLVDEFLAALELEKVGNTEPLKVFVCETLAEPWSEGQQYDRKDVITAGYHLGVVTELKEWEFIFLMVDVQAYDFWHVVRGWKSNGDSRLLSRGRLSTWGDIRDKAKEFSLTDAQAKFVYLDSRFKGVEVRREAAMQGWTCLMGEDRRNYSHQSRGHVVHRIYSEPRVIDPSIGTSDAGGRPCVEFLFGDTSAQDLLQRQLDGIGTKFDIPGDVGDEYQKQIRNEVKVLRKNKITGREGWEWKRIGPNHLRDCEKMGVVAACMTGLLMEIPEGKS